MKRSIVLMSVLLCLAPMGGALAGPTVVHLSYLGLGQFQYKKQAYSYDGLVAAIQADYSGETIDQVVVDMGHIAGQLEKAKICPLRQSLQTQVRMFITEEGKEREMFCN